MKDVAIIGAGPVGLCLARALAGAGMSVALIDRIPREALANPAVDGREIAMTQASCDLLADIDVWQRIPTAEVAPLERARVFNGASDFSMGFDGGDGSAPLGFMVPNHCIRRAAFDEAQRMDGIEWFEGDVASITTDTAAARMRLADGRDIHARLAVAADSRFSASRRQMGIAAEMRDNGRAMMVCRISHEIAHDQSAWEWFDHGQTLALLPISEHLSSAVVTLPSREMDALMALPAEAFSAALSQRYGHRLGTMTLEGDAHVYPLVSVYAERFCARRFVLVGDAAVGMHPVTAHGFNFGAHSQARLARRLIAAHRQGRDIAGARLLAAYEREHRLATRPLYLATQAIVSLYTDDRLPARALRHAGLRLGERLAPLRSAIGRQLTGTLSVPSLADLPHPRLPRLVLSDRTR
ncbi:5-demethoxyubiquinol-8 5-hydroxylase UbiM [Halomonas sp. V046]|uniref:5-demethoxyubiquinol-8 5-hydroxylase UbiM n=1 Tax=Halomonas sp. V046 TaxID=3459611 RepID=UPI004044C4F9